MRYFVLACDYDGTLAHHGKVANDTLAALERLLGTGRKLILVTGRELDELLGIFPEIHFFEWVVAENGALLYRPANKEVKLLAPPPPGDFVNALYKRGVGPISVGRAIIATWHPHETAVLEEIRRHGLELQVIFNKGAVMVLPAGVTKATGLAAALGEMCLTYHENVGVGDAENDHAFLNLCESSFAVANALPAVKDRCDFTTEAPHGLGVIELVDQLLADDLASVESRLVRHHLLLGKDEADADVRLAPHGPSLLIAGPSGSGKSTANTSFLERLQERQYQFCVIDPEGDYETLDFAISLGTHDNAPALEEILQVLAKPGQNCVVNMVGMRIGDRPNFFLKLLPSLLELRARTGRPHWLIVDEAHHLLPASWEPGAIAFPEDARNIAYITVHPDQVHPTALRGVGTVMAVGRKPDTTLQSFCKAVGRSAPVATRIELDSGEVLLWQQSEGLPPRRVHLTPSRTERRRHVRKYAEGTLPPDRSFYFRGPEGKLNLRAQNLMLFLQIADGVDDATWLHHLGQGDYSRWFRDRVKDDGLATEAEAIEREPGLSAKESRKRIRDVIERRYTQAESAPLPIPGTDAAPTQQRRPS